MQVLGTVLAFKGGHVEGAPAKVGCADPLTEQPAARRVKAAGPDIAHSLYKN